MQHDNVEKILSDMQYELRSVAISIAEITINQKRDNKEFEGLKILLEKLESRDNEMEKKIRDLENLKLIAHGGWVVFCILCSTILSAVSVLIRVL